MKSCTNGHYYNEEKESKCPYCSNNTILENIGTEEYAKLTYDKNNDAKTQIIDLNQNTQITKKIVDMEEKTIMLNRDNYSSTIKIDRLNTIELVGWIVTISNKGRGCVYNLTYGMNTIGRSTANQISINHGDSSISREKHASIIYDFENNLFFIQHHNGKYLTYLNKKMILTPTLLNPYDKIKIGMSEFIFVPLCGENFKWEDINNSS